MANNTTVAIYLFYTETSISHLNSSDLYAHVHKTATQLGIPTPARAHVKKIGDGTICIERLSCQPSGLKNLGTAIAKAGDLSLRTTLGLIAISQSHLPPQAFTRNSSASAERTLHPPARESCLPQNVSHRTDEHSVPDSCLLPLSSALRNKVPEKSRIQRQHIPSTLPPKPSWVTGSRGYLHSFRVVSKTEPISPAIVGFPPGDARSLRAPEASKYPTSAIEEGYPIFRKREHEIVEGGEIEESPAHKRRRQENSPSHSEDSSRPYRPTNRTNDKRLHGLSAQLKNRPEEDQETNVQSLRKNVSDLEKSLHEEKIEVSLLRKELEEERGKRFRAESIVEDIRREMKDPFIVPSLLDAFINITKISNVCVEESL